jgi:hypothetical protein
MPQPSATAARTLACARCGSVFECARADGCWCAAEPYRLPLTAAGANEGCLCPACLRQAALSSSFRDGA